MASVTQETIAKGNQLVHVSRPARALIGWLAQDQGELILAQRQVNALLPEHSEKVRNARAAVDHRPLITDQSALASDLPSELEQYANEFKAQKAFAPFATEG